jgi:lipopolysaccharide export system permease protein
MRILTYYIGRTIFATTLLVLLLLVCLGFFIQLIGEFGSVGKGSYGLLQALEYAALSLPQLIYQVFPMIGLVGVMLGLGLLTNHSELIVMRAAGVSVGQIARAVMIAVLIMVLLMTLMGEFVAPKLFRHAEVFKMTEKSSGQAIATQDSVWVRDQNSFIHIVLVLKNTKLQNVTRYVFNKQHQLLEVSHAKELDFTHGQWQASGVTTSMIHPDSITSKNVASESWDITLVPDILRVAQIDPEEMSLLYLKSVVEYKKKNNLNVGNYSLAFWQRLFQPLATGVMMFLAIPFIFGPMRSVTMGFRLLTGVLVGFAFYILNQFFGPISLVYQLPAVLAAILPTLLFAFVAYFMMRRLR